MDADLFLNWMTVANGGSLRQLRDKLCWFAREVHAAGRRARANYWIRNAVDLGYFEADWSDDCWVATEPVLTTIPQGSGHALLAGSRDRVLDSTLDALITDAEIYGTRVPALSDGRMRMPTTVYIEYQDRDQLYDAAELLGVRVVPDAFRQLAIQLKRLSPTKPCAPPASADPTWKWDRVRREFRPTSRALAEGLYRHQLFGTHSYRLHQSGKWFHVGRAEGIFLESSGIPTGYLYWRPDPEGSVGLLRVAGGVDLPPAQRRVLSLCTGQLAVLSDNRSVLYRNIPLDTAERIAWSLDYPLNRLAEEL